MADDLAAQIRAIDGLPQLLADLIGEGRVFQSTVDYETAQRWVLRAYQAATQKGAAERDDLARRLRSCQMMERMATRHAYERDEDVARADRLLARAEMFLAGEKEAGRRQARNLLELDWDRDDLRAVYQAAGAVVAAWRSDEDTDMNPTLEALAAAVAAYNDREPVGVPDRRADEDEAWGSIWLHGAWRWLTSKMTTPAREAAAAAVERWWAAMDAADGEDGHSDESRAELYWWRDTQPAHTSACDRLRLHLLAVHGNLAAPWNDDRTALSNHRHEHRGAGGIRNHEERYLYWTEEQIRDLTAGDDIDHDQRGELAAAVADLTARLRTGKPIPKAGPGRG